MTKSGRYKRLLVMETRRGSSEFSECVTGTERILKSLFLVFGFFFSFLDFVQ